MFFVWDNEPVPDKIDVLLTFKILFKRPKMTNKLKCTECGLIFPNRVIYEFHRELPNCKQNKNEYSEMHRIAYPTPIHYPVGYYLTLDAIYTIFNTCEYFHYHNPGPLPLDLLDPDKLPVNNTQFHCVKHIQVSSVTKPTIRKYSKKSQNQRTSTEENYDPKRPPKSARVTIMGKIRQCNIPLQPMHKQYMQQIKQEVTIRDHKKRIDGTVLNYPDHTHFSFIKSFETWEQWLKDVEKVQP